VLVLVVLLYKDGSSNLELVSTKYMPEGEAQFNLGAELTTIFDEIVHIVTPRVHPSCPSGNHETQDIEAGRRSTSCTLSINGQWAGESGNGS
jgi:hypothetical protein